VIFFIYLNGSLHRSIQKSRFYEMSPIPPGLAFVLQRHLSTQLITVLLSEWNDGICSVTIHLVTKDGALEICVKILLGSFKIRC